jgi:2-haloalkanoic acid dehalogenase type II
MNRSQAVDRAGATAPLITFDLFSALTDSRTGASRVLDELALGRGWPARGEQVYDLWDRTNKELQRTIRTWRPFAEHSGEAMTSTYAALGLAGDARDDTELLLRSVGDWPLWPDVVPGLEQVRARARIGVLSNVDGDIWSRTRAARLGFAPDDVLTSQRLQAYKPAPVIYRRAAELHPNLRLHVASSARDVRGALESGLRTIRLIRPGHVVDPAGPVPGVQVYDIAEVAAFLE